MSGFTLLAALAVGAKLWSFKGKMKKSALEMGITVLKTVIWGDKSSVLWSQIPFYGSANAHLKNKISIHKTDDLPPQMTILQTVIS